MDSATSATTMTEALKIAKAVRTAFNIYRFDHLDSASLEVALKLFKNKGWKLPPSLQSPEPEEELTLLRAIKDYITSHDKNRTERKLFAIDRLVEYFGEHMPLERINVSEVKKYRRHRQGQGVSNATINIEISALSGIFREQLEMDVIDSNPCSVIRRLPQNQRDSYLSWDDFNRMMEVADWLHQIILMLYYTGMRPSEVFELDWSEIDFGRRMIILPACRTKEGKNENQEIIHEKRVPMRKEVFELLSSLKHPDTKLMRATGRVFTHKGRLITRGTKRKCWSRICRLTGLEGFQLRDFRHTFKTNLTYSDVQETVVDAIVGHATHLEVSKLYIHCSDTKLLEAVNKMTLDHGPTAISQSGRKKSDAKMTPNTVSKTIGHAGT
jgi:integrase